MAQWPAGDPVLVKDSTYTASMTAALVAIELQQSEVTISSTVLVDLVTRLNEQQDGASVMAWGPEVYALRAQIAGLNEQLDSRGLECEAFERDIDLLQGELLGANQAGQAVVNELMRVEAELADYKRGADEEARAGDQARAERAEAERRCAAVSRLATEWQLKNDALRVQLRQLQALVEAQAAVVSAAEELDPLAAYSMARLRKALMALDQATTPASGEPSKC